MLKTKCIHPEILGVLGTCGHGDKIMIADGNFALDSNVNENTKKIYLNLTHGIPTVTDVLDTMLDTIPVEKVEVMMPVSGEEPPIYADFRKALGPGYELNAILKPDFYEECKKSNVKLAILTGERKTFGNILLTIGVTRWS